VKREASVKWEKKKGYTEGERKVILYLGRKVSIFFLSLGGGIVSSSEEKMKLRVYRKGYYL